ncbi:Oidioi.mRNA.OKI2018_I69.chr2.g7764.t1.cds [Oikopleura dioica]|uniref:Oidioi.mRNA.OKI2018_I69.chr2.g7764.t1.cds n=1 Tax=Oikopleura dioica TaxID=34765 RepID=A0ABN7TD39_OIKDI|nr:Oidioi.mRNA.OKI2018_I69.chr2.g7764.t1.cds [Oikopleura dioica]
MKVFTLNIFSASFANGFIMSTPPEDIVDYWDKNNLFDDRHPFEFGEMPTKLHSLLHFKDFVDRKGTELDNPAYFFFNI